MEKVKVTTQTKTINKLWAHISEKRACKWIRSIKIFLKPYKTEIGHRENKWAMKMIMICSKYEKVVLIYLDLLIIK